MIEYENSNHNNNEHNHEIIPAKESYYLTELWKANNFKELLDLGCGFGRNSIYFAKKDFKVTAVDLSDYAINNVNEWAKRENLRIHTELCDMIDLPFKDNTFDSIIAHNVIYHTDTKGFVKIIDEIKRILKINGEAFITLISKNALVYKNINAYGRVDENTILIDENPNKYPTEKNVPHFFVDINDIKKYFNEFEFVTPPIEETQYNMDFIKSYSTHFKFIIRKI